MIVVGGWPGRNVIGLNGRFGVLPSAIASGGDFPSPLANDVDFGDDAVEIAPVVQALPDSGLVTFEDDGAFSHTGASDGTRSTHYRLYTWGNNALTEHSPDAAARTTFGAASGLPNPESYTASFGAVVYAGRSAPPISYPATARIMLWGQSNADGRGLISDISAAPLSSDPELATLAADPFGRVRIWNGNAYVALELGVNNGGLNPAPGSGTQFGPEFGLAVRWMRETSSGTLYIDKIGVSGASITAFNPEPAYDNYQLMQTERAQANFWLASAGVTVEQEAHIWIQGETDRLQDQSWYQTRMQAIINAAIVDGWWSETDIQLLFQMGTTSTLYGAGVAAAKAAIAAASPAYIKTPASANHWDSSGYHQNARGQVQIGYDAFALIFGAPTITV